MYFPQHKFYVAQFMIGNLRVHYTSKISQWAKTATFCIYTHAHMYISMSKDMFEIHMSVWMAVQGVCPHLVQVFPTGGSKVQWGLSTTCLLTGRTITHNTYYCLE